VRRLDEVPGWQEFYDSTAHLEPQNYLFDAQRFCHKVYAMLDAFESRHRYVVWIDADTVFKRRLGQKFLINLLSGKMCAYLGRQGSYTETGFLVFDTHHSDFSEFKKRLRDLYDKRYLFMLDYWIDCLAIDAAMLGLSGNNLTPGATGMVNVFTQSPISDYIDHDKGQGHGKYRRDDEKVHGTA
jgi:hypothetical protein